MRVVLAAAIASCGVSSEPAKPGPVSSAPEPGGAVVTTSSPPPSTGAAPPPASGPSASALFPTVIGELTACYEEGKRAVPTMTAGKITFLISGDADGKTACIVPSDDSGLTQDVENCMRGRLEKQTYAKTSGPWSFALPLVVKDAKLSQGEARNAPAALETIESHGLAEDVYDVVEGLLPDLYGCMSGIPKSSDLRVVYVGAKVGGGGQVECALASAPSTIPVETRTCTAKVFSRARFRAPKKGYGLVAVPLNVMSRK